MKWWRHWLVACSLVAVSPMLAAQETTRMGYVNTERILRDAVPAKPASASASSSSTRKPS